MAEVSVFKPLSFTKLGLMLEAKLRTGVALKLTRVVIGDGTLEEGESPLDITKLKHEITSHQTGTVGTGTKVDMSHFKVLEAGITDLRVVVESSDSDFVLRELAIMADDPDVGEIPYLYTYGGTDAFKNGVTVRRTYDFTDIITNATDIQVNTTIVDGVDEMTFEEFKTTTNKSIQQLTEQIQELERKVQKYRGEDAVEQVSITGNFDTAENDTLIVDEETINLLRNIPEGTTFWVNVTAENNPEDEHTINHISDGKTFDAYIYDMQEGDIYTYMTAYDRPSRFKCRMVTQTSPGVQGTIITLY